MKKRLKKKKEKKENKKNEVKEVGGKMKMNLKKEKAMKVVKKFYPQIADIYKKGDDFLNKVYSVYTIKGGVGKTTLATNLAVTTTMMGYKTLFIDTDPQGNGTSLFIHSDPSDKTVKDVFSGVLSIEKVIKKYETGYGSLDVVGASYELFQCEEIIKSRFVLKKQIDMIKEMYDFIFIDTNPSISILSENAIACSHGVIAPLQMEGFSIDGLNGLKRKINEMGIYNPNIGIEFIVPMMKSNTSIQNHIIKQIKIQEEGVTPSIRRASVVATSQYNCTPLVNNTKNKKDKVLCDFFKVAEKIIKES